MNGFCAVSFALLGSSIATMMMNRQYMQDFEDSLDKSQKQIYAEIKKERLTIYLIATVIAITIGFLVSKNNTCLGVASALSLQMLIYLVWPKSKYMLDHVKKPKQSSLWIQKYKHMSTLGYVGMIVGLLVYFSQYYKF